MESSSSPVVSWILAHERLVMIILVSVLSVSSFFLFIWPRVTDLRSGGALDGMQARVRLEEKRDRLRRYEASQQVSGRIAAEEQKKLSYILPSEDDIPSLLVQLSRLAKDNGLSIQEIALGTSPSLRGSQGEKTPAFLREVPLSLKVIGGDYAILKNFLESLERHMRVMDVLSFNVSPDLATYAFVLRTYYLLP